MANNNKQILMTILIALVVGILSSAITASIVSRNVLLGPTVPPKEIKANSCNADNTCETNNVIAEGAEIVNLGVLETLSTSNIESNLDLTIVSREGGIILNGYEDGVTIAMRNAANENFAFVCADDNGRLFMKSTPCS